MPSSYSSLLRLELMAVGEKSNTWGDITNTNLGTLLEKAIAGAVSINVASGNVTLTTSNGGDDQARCALLLITGSPGTTRAVTAPSSSKTYIVINNSNSPVVIKGAVTTGVTLASGTKSIVAWTGSDFELVGLSATSPAFVGVPTAPTAAVDTSTTQIATTAFVVNQITSHPQTVAWGRVTNTGTAALLQGYNIASVSRSAAGTVLVTFTSNPNPLDSDYGVVVTPLSGNNVIATVNLISSGNFTVLTRTPSTGTSVDASFMFTVTY